MSDLTKLTQSWPHELINWVHELQDLGFELVLVGGATRDFLLKNKIVNDLDFEVRALNKNKKPWYQNIKSWPSEYQVLDFGVVKLDAFGFQIELAPARVEKFDHHQLSPSHSGFKAEFSPSLTYQESFQRRDFTINAIGLKISTLEIIDPFSGIEDLKKKKLRPCHEKDFFLDPVRFLRYLRFHQLFTNTELDSKICHPFDLSALSSFYLWKEAHAAHSFSHFLTDVLKSLLWVEQLPVWYKGLKQIEFLNNLGDSLEELVFQFCLENKKEQLEIFVQHFPQKISHLNFLFGLHQIWDENFKKKRFDFLNQTSAMTDDDLYDAGQELFSYARWLKKLDQIPEKLRSQFLSLHVDWEIDFHIITSAPSLSEIMKKMWLERGFERSKWSDTWLLKQLLGQI